MKESQQFSNARLGDRTKSLHTTVSESTTKSDNVRDQLLLNGEKKTKKNTTVAV